MNAIRSFFLMVACGALSSFSFAFQEEKPNAPEALTLKRLIAEAHVSLDALYKKGDFHALAGLEAEWVQKIENFLRENPQAEDQEKAFLLLVNLLGSAQDAGGAIKNLYDRIKVQGAAQPWFSDLLRSIYYQLHVKDRDALLQILTDAETLSPEAEAKGVSLFYRGEVFMTAGDNENAKKLFQRVLQEFPDTSLKDPARMNLYEIDHLQPGMAAPDIKIPLLGGGEIDLNGLKGKVVLLVFWTHWAPLLPDCVKNLSEIHQQSAKDPFVLLGITLDEPSDLNALKKTVEDLKMTWPQGYDSQGWQSPLMEKYNIKTVPRSFLIDAQGGIKAKDILYEPDLKQRVSQAVAERKGEIQRQLEEEKKKLEAEKKKAEEKKAKEPAPQPKK